MGKSERDEYMNQIKTNTNRARIHYEFKTQAQHINRQNKLKHLEKNKIAATTAIVTATATGTAMAMAMPTTKLDVFGLLGAQIDVAYMKFKEWCAWPNAEPSERSRVQRVYSKRHKNENL